jgi:hypothetical protein
MSPGDRQRVTRPQPDGIQVLAALRRAAEHRPRPDGAVSARELLAHLDLAPRSAGARSARAALARLQAAGAVACARRHGVPVWSLTAAGETRLRAAPRARAGLPESPQHRAWRHAHTTAELELDRFCAALRASLREADALLDRPGAPSRTWFELAERLRRRAWLVGSASHCLYEWAEPGDTRPDVDADAGAEVAGRRNVRLWADPL